MEGENLIFGAIPEEVIYTEVFPRIPTNTLIKLCQTNPRIKNLCENFWRDKSLSLFNNINKPNNITWLQHYLFLENGKNLPIYDEQDNEIGNIILRQGVPKWKNLLDQLPPFEIDSVFVVVDNNNLPKIIILSPAYIDHLGREFIVYDFNYSPSEENIINLRAVYLLTGNIYITFFEMIDRIRDLESQKSIIEYDTNELNENLNDIIQELNELAIETIYNI